ncbi:hypothetical protein [Streptomyces sp. NRRL S-87]|uniref:hypothetical protein n=1 Tax=Streptomyces sp. NRRL S-87 TaxID=1463920 RepID=UPI0004C1138D|nr:hypothetical protein [Streptomyces sp. NRRL S-87]
MTHIKFWSVHCPGMAAVFEPIVLRVEEEVIFNGNIGPGETLEVDVRMPIVTMKVELGTSDIDGLGNPTGPFRNFLYEEIVDPFHIEFHDALKLAVLHNESTIPQTAVFRSKIPGHEGKFELSFSLPG